ncbi:unnamed protein product [Symbiodinium sp. KB8]|nr:unnamed protein product [Symbiodinium sp. KB8]
MDLDNGDELGGEDDESTVPGLSTLNQLFLDQADRVETTFHDGRDYGAPLRDYQVISYFRRKQGAHASQLEYSLRCGGSGPAVGGLKAFYRDKYDPVDVQHLHDPLALYKAQVGSFMPAPALVTKEELEQVLLQTKSRKSCGQDGAPYELWCAVLQPEAADHLVDFVNRILLEDVDFPEEWLNPQIVLLPKVKEPKHPKDFRPIVLAATLSKLVTKVFLVRLRDHFPPMPTGQLSAQKGAQSLDGSVALKHLVHLSRQWGLPLLACKLDIQAAFDTEEVDEVACFTFACDGSRKGAPGQKCKYSGGCSQKEIAGLLNQRPPASVADIKAVSLEIQNVRSELDMVRSELAEMKRVLSDTHQSTLDARVEAKTEVDRLENTFTSYDAKFDSEMAYINQRLDELHVKADKTKDDIRDIHMIVPYQQNIQRVVDDIPWHAQQISHGCRQMDESVGKALENTRLVGEAHDELCEYVKEALGELLSRLLPATSTSSSRLIMVVQQSQAALLGSGA